jgi:hypothetical protein
MVTKSGQAGDKIIVTPEMVLAGAECLDEFIREGSGLICTSVYVAEMVYLAMEKRKESFANMLFGEHSGC